MLSRGLRSGVRSMGSLARLGPAAAVRSSPASLARPRPALIDAQPRRALCSDDHRTTFHVQDPDDFQARVVDSSVPVIVQFTADWCGPCKQLGPRLEAVVSGMGGKVLHAKVNIDDNQELAMDFDVSAVPTLVAFKDGAPAGEEEPIVGSVEDATLQALADRLTHS